MAVGSLCSGIPARKRLWNTEEISGISSIETASRSIMEAMVTT